MELTLSIAVGVMFGSGVWLILRPRSFQLITGLLLMSYAVNLFIFAMGRLWVAQPPITPMPALTFMHSTTHTSQNWGMPQTFFTCTWRLVIMALEAWATGGVQPAGFQPEGGTR